MAPGQLRSSLLRKLFGPRPSRLLHVLQVACAEPRWSGNSVRSSVAIRPTTFVPHLSAPWRSRIVRPISQYIWSISVFTLSCARRCAPRTIDLRSSTIS